MKFAMRLDYNRYLVMDQPTFTKLIEVLSKCEVRYQNGYGKDALYTPDSNIPNIVMLKEEQLVDSIPEVEGETNVA